MCGICAVSRVDGRSSISNPTRYMHLASYAIEDRGPHATGFAHHDGDKTWYWSSPGSAWDVAHKAKLDGARVAIGHTRYATQGKPEMNENNHPLVEENIVLVHNGIVSNDDEIFKEISDVPRHNEVDSQAIACLLAYPDAFGAETGIEAVEAWFQGDAALAWIDTDEPEVLHLARCAGRPMWLAHTRRGDLVMASTDEALDKLKRMANIRLRDYEPVPEGTHLQVRAGEIIHTEEFEPYRKPKANYGKPSTTTGSSTSKPPAKKPTVVVGTFGNEEDDDLNAWPGWDDFVHAKCSNRPKTPDTEMDEVGLHQDEWAFLWWSEPRLIDELEHEWCVRPEDFDFTADFQTTLGEFEAYLIEEAKRTERLVRVNETEVTV